MPLHLFSERELGCLRAAVAVGAEGADFSHPQETVDSMLSCISGDFDASALTPEEADCLVDCFEVGREAEDGSLDESDLETLRGLDAKVFALRPAGSPGAAP